MLRKLSFSSRNSVHLASPLSGFSKRSMLYQTSPTSPTVPYKTLYINYANIIEQVLSYYSSENFQDSPMNVHFIYSNKQVEKKSSVDMFMAFWQFAFEKYFVGKNGSYVPRLDINGECLTSQEAVALGKIIAHGFYTSGYLPLYGLCKASLIYCLTGLIPSEKVLLEAYMKSIDDDYREIVEEALLFINSRSFFQSKAFTAEMESSLLNFFHESGLKAIPRAENFRKLLIRSSMFYCIEKPHFILNNIRKGILLLNPNWENLSEDMASIFLNTCHNTGQCQPVFCDADNPNFDLNDGGSNYSSSSRSSLFGK